jgi:hypothetical protein
MSEILILGASSDVAMALANLFASAGYDIILAARNSSRLSPLQADLNIRHGIKCTLLEFDAAAFDTHEAFITKFHKMPDITVCAFGYLGNQELAQENFHETERIISANYIGAVSILNLIASRYKKHKKGCIIGISSVAGERGRNSNYLYGSAKSGFTTYLSGLRNHLFPFGILVISVIPGFISSKMTSNIQLPALLTATPDDVARKIYKAYNSKKDIVYIKWFWKWIMLIIRNIPEFIFKKMKL